MNFRNRQLCRTAATDTAGSTAVHSNNAPGMGGATGIKNIVREIEVSIEGITTRIREFVFTTDPSSAYLVYTDDVAPIGSYGILLTVVAGAVTAGALYVKKAANNGSSTSGFTAVTQA